MGARDQGLGRLCDPHRRSGQPGSRRLAYQGKGSIGRADISADKAGILLERNISNRETRLSILDLVTGKAFEIPLGRQPAARSESAIVAAMAGRHRSHTDGSDVRRLVEFDIANGKGTS